MKIAGSTVMVVDDEPELVEIFSFWLKRSGAIVLTALNGADALKVLTEQRVHALVSDIRMPVMDGIALVKSLHERQLSVPTIVFVSGFTDVSYRALYAMGVSALITKPLRRGQLVDTLAVSMLEPEELWVTPPDSPAQTELAVDIPSLKGASAGGGFALGTGGCCLPAAKAIVDTSVELRVHFLEEAFLLRGRGIVRWHDSRTHCAGIEFTYLEPPARAWVLDRLRSSPTQSFIPSCA